MVGAPADDPQQLAASTEELLTLGADSRAHLIDGGLNRYGCRPTPRAAIPFGSCTASCPNSQVYGQTIRNFNGFDTRRIDLVVGISYDDDISKAIDTIRSVVQADDRVLAEPETNIAVSNLGDSSVDLVVRPWCNGEDYWALRFDLTRRIKEELEDAGCSIPFPQTEVQLHQKSA